jgi:hypothetical protein
MRMRLGGRACREPECRLHPVFIWISRRSGPLAIFFHGQRGQQGHQVKLNQLQQPGRHAAKQSRSYTRPHHQLRFGHHADRRPCLNCHGYQAASAAHCARVRAAARRPYTSQDARPHGRFDHRPAAPARPGARHRTAPHAHAAGSDAGPHARNLSRPRIHLSSSRSCRRTGLTFTSACAFRHWTKVRPQAGWAAPGYFSTAIRAPGFRSIPPERPPPRGRDRSAARKRRDNRRNNFRRTTGDSHPNGDSPACDAGMSFVGFRLLARFA